MSSDEFMVCDERMEEGSKFQIISGAILHTFAAFATDSSVVSTVKSRGNAILQWIIIARYSNHTNDRWAICILLYCEFISYISTEYCGDLSKFDKDISQLKGPVFTPYINE